MAITVFNQFANISGLRMNKQKTEAMWLGREKSSRAEHQNLKWVRQIVILGVHFRSDISAHNIEDNWSDKIERMKTILSSGPEEIFASMVKL